MTKSKSKGRKRRDGDVSAEAQEVRKAFNNLKKNVHQSAEDWYEAYNRAKAGGGKSEKEEDSPQTSQTQSKQDDANNIQSSSQSTSNSPASGSQNLPKPPLKSALKKPSIPAPPKPAFPRPAIPTPPRPAIPTPPRPAIPTPPRSAIPTPPKPAVSAPPRPNIATRPSQGGFSQNEPYPCHDVGKDLSTSEKFRLIDEWVEKMVFTPAEAHIARRVRSHLQECLVHYRIQKLSPLEENELSKKTFSGQGSGSRDRPDDKDDLYYRRDQYPSSDANSMSPSGNRGGLHDADWPAKRKASSSDDWESQEQMRSSKSLKSGIPDQGGNELYERRGRGQDSSFPNQNSWNIQGQYPANRNMSSPSADNIMNCERRNIASDCSTGSASTDRSIHSNWSGPQHMRDASNSGNKELYERRDSNMATNMQGSSYSQNRNMSAGNQSSANWERGDRSQNQFDRNYTSGTNTCEFMGNKNELSEMNLSRDRRGSVDSNRSYNRGRGFAQRQADSSQRGFHSGNRRGGTNRFSGSSFQRKNW